MHYWESVPGWTDYQDVYSWGVQTAAPGDTLVEVGTFLGRSCAFMMEEIQKSGKPLKLYCVDLFKITPDDADTGGTGCMPWGEDAKKWTDRMGYDALYDTAKWYLDHSPARTALTEMIQGDSAGSAHRFADNSLHFVFIDASHRYENVKRDLAAWWPKVKTGCYMCGHDWLSGEEVRKALLEFLREKGIEQVATANNCWIVEKKAAA